jgi:hypothetical protein
MHTVPACAPTQSAAAAHARHVWVPTLHVGNAPAQSPFALHPTHEPIAVSHAAVPPAHWVLLVAEHWPHAPEG